MNNSISKFKRFFKHHSATILTCLGGIGVVSTAIMTAKATPKAMEILRQSEAEKGEQLTSWEVITTTVPVYIPTILVGVSTLCCIFGANALNIRQQASLVSAYSMLNSSYNEYKNKVRELYGEEAHQNVIDSIAQERATKSNLIALGSFVNCGLEEDDDDIPRLFYDVEGKRYFESTLSKVIAAEYHFNRNFALRGFATLNELYSLLCISPIDDGDLIGWSAEDMITNEGLDPWIDFNHRKTEIDEGLIAYIIEIPYGPTMEAIQDW